MRIAHLLVAIGLCSIPLLAAAIDTENVLSTRYRGRVALSSVELRSNCNSSSTDNRWENGLLASKGRIRFEPGELLYIDGVDLHRKRIDLNLRLIEPLLESYYDGPFTLYREIGCRVELELRVDRDLVKGDAVEALAEIIDRFVSVMGSENEARDSGMWNSRVRDPYPDDYEQTLADYAIWKVEQWNLAVDHRLGEALTRARRIAYDPADNPAEALGFSAGLEAWNDPREIDCDRLVSGHLGLPDSPDRPAGSSRDHDEELDKRFDRGARRGLELGRALFLLEALPGCYQTPPMP